MATMRRSDCRYMCTALRSASSLARTEKYRTWRDCHRWLGSFEGMLLGDFSVLGFSSQKLGHKLISLPFIRKLQRAERLVSDEKRHRHTSGKVKAQ